MLAALFPGVGHLQNIHPLTVHFPLAFLSGAVVLYLAAWLFRKDYLAISACTCLALGALAAVASAGTGLYAEPGVMVSRSVRAVLLHRHKVLMLATSALAFPLAAWAVAARPFPVRGRLVFILLLLIMLAVMGFGSDYGARMVYDYNAGGSACPQPIEFDK